ncbi:MAG: flagellar hook assembly protein FlgD [Desulfonatronovibrionaceae bacterium]
MIGQWDREREEEKIPSGENHGELGKMEFLELLMTQLENQDPLNPMDDKQFVAQLAQFSSLEQLTNISEGVTAMNQNNTQQDMVGAVGFIGKEIMAEGDEISKTEDGVSTMYYSLDDTAAKMYFNIFDGDGNMVRTVEMQARQAGEYEFKWDGKDYSGNLAPDGNYSVSIAAEGQNGEPVMVDSSVAGRVSGVQNVNGQPHLRLSDGRMINFNEVSEVVGAGSETEEDDK